MQKRFSCRFKCSYGQCCYGGIPDFDPNIFARGITQKEWNELSQNPLKPMVNLAISAHFTRIYFKMVTATAALEESYK